jgi:small-conductance mechanosensitive channel
MGDWIRLVGENHAVEILGVKLVGVNAENGKKLLFTIAFIIAIILIDRLARGLARLILRGRRNQRLVFWTRQGVMLCTTVVMLVGLASIWFDDPTRLATALGLVTAGLAFALQKVVTAVAAYFVILRGKTFNVGDRIRMGGVRGDVIALGFIQTTIMEMGEPPGTGDDENVWVHSRQYTGRVVTVTNDKIFEEPVYNYTREFPCIWEELSIPTPYSADRKRVEQILLDVAGRCTVKLQELNDDVAKELQRRYFMQQPDLTPRVYYRLTDNWLELTVRFVARSHAVRELKDRMSREILAALQEANIGIASATSEIVGMPTLRVEHVNAPR